MVREITILLIGEEYVGKSSIISSFVSQIFSERVPGIMQTIRIPPDQSESNVIVNVIDSQGANFLQYESNGMMHSTFSNPNNNNAMNESVLNMSVMSQLSEIDANFDENLDDPNMNMNMNMNTYPNANMNLKVMEDENNNNNNNTNANANTNAITNTNTNTNNTNATTNTTTNIINNNNNNIQTGSSSADEKNEKRLSIIAVADLDRPETFERLKDYWLPLIEKTCPNTPVLIAGNKSDLRENIDAEEQKRIANPILERYKFVDGYMECSAKSLQAVNELFFQAQSNILYPTQPLFDVVEGELTTKLFKVLARIFRLLDHDRDDFLSDGEFFQFELDVFRVKLVESDIEGFKNFIRKRDPNRGVVDQKISLVGFCILIELLIIKNNTKVPWTMLRYFGYDDNLNLALPDALLQGENCIEDDSYDDKKKSKSKFDSFSVSSYFSKNNNSNNSLEARYKKNKGLSDRGVKFLTAAFKNANANANADIDASLSSSDLHNFFDVLQTTPLPPWHPNRSEEFFSDSFSRPKIEKSVLLEISKKRSLDNLINDNVGSVTIIPEGNEIEDESTDLALLPSLTMAEWIGKWHLCATIDPLKTKILLYQLGHDVFADDEDGGGNNDNGNNGKNGNEELTPTPPTTPKLCIHCCVAGIGGIGKSAFIEKITNNFNYKNDAENNKAESSFVQINEELYAVLTEVQSSSTRLLEQLHNFDLVVLAFASSDLRSLEYCLEVDGKLPDFVKRIFVRLDGGKGGEVVGGQAVTEEVMQIAARHCEMFDLELPWEGGVEGEGEGEEGLAYLANCVHNSNTKTTPLALQKKREARNRKILRFVGVGCVVGLAVGVGWQYRQNLPTLKLKELLARQPTRAAAVAAAVAVNRSGYSNKNVI